MSAIVQGAGDAEAGSEAAGRALIGGRIRDEIGLKSADLAVGLEVARNLLKRGQTQEALRTYAGLILCEPANVQFQIGLANCALTLGENHLALQAASVVIALAPREPRGYLLSARACIGLDALTEAEEDLADAVALGRDAREPTLVEEAQRLLQALPKRTSGAATLAAAG